jgi:hypothetical protein
MLSYLKSSDAKKIESIVGIGFLLSLIIPQSNIFLFLITPLLCVFFKLYIKGNNQHLGTKYLVLFSFSITFLMYFSSVQSIKPILSFANIILVFAVFPNIGGVRIRNTLIYFALLYVLFSQIIYILNVPALSNLLNTLYPIEDDYLVAVMENVSVQNKAFFRSGGIYRNPNDCARIITLLIAIFAVENRDGKLSEIIPFIIISLVAVFLTGSRTGLAVSILILVFGFFLNQKHRGSTIRIVFVAAIVAILLYSVLNVTDSRITDYENTGSIDVKYATLMNYLSQNNSLIVLLFGNLDPDSFVSTNDMVLDFFDADYGYLLYCYGIIGFLCVVVFFVSLFNRMNKGKRFVLLLLVWAVSNSLIFSYRMFFPMMLVFSRCLCESANLSEKNMSC